jgi:hypothetical protein
MNAKIKHPVAGYYRFEAFRQDADGNEIPGSRRVACDWQKNLITDVGMDMLGHASDSAWMAGCHVGTGTAAPAVGNTALQTFFAGVATTVATSNGVNGAEPYYGYRRRTFRFAEGTFDNDNLTEAGISYGTSGVSGTARLNTAPLFSRVLIDGGTGITILSDESLDVIFEVRNYAPTVDVEDTVVISEVSYDFILRACNVTTLAYWAEGTSFVWTGDVFSGGASRTKAYSGAIGAITGEPATAIDGGIGANAAIAAREPYVAGTFYRDVTWTWGLSATSGSYRSFRIVTQGGSYQLELDPPMVKDETMTISLQLRMSWARA